MIIDRTAAVVPTRYAHKVLREAMGSRIARADHNDLLAAFLWLHEGKITRILHKLLDRHYTRISKEIEHAQRRTRSPFSQAPMDVDYCDVAQETLEKLEIELAPAKLARDQVADTWRAMRDDYGATEKIRTRYERDNEAEPSPLDIAMQKHWHAYDEADSRVDKIMANDHDLTHALALREGELLAFLESPGSVSMDDINTMHHAEFERTIAELTVRDGFTMVRGRGGAGDLGADVIALAPGGHTRVVIQCKHTRTGQTKVGSPVLQRLNGTARQVHHADVVVAVTNGSFSMPASSFARSQDIKLIERRALEEWATWGTSLSEILNLATIDGLH